MSARAADNNYTAEVVPLKGVNWSDPMTYLTIGGILLTVGAWLRPRKSAEPKRYRRGKRNRRRGKHRK